MCGVSGAEFSNRVIRIHGYNTVASLAFKMGTGASTELNEESSNSLGLNEPQNRRGSDENSITSQESRNGAVTSTGGLQILLQQPFLRENFRGFVSSQWIPSDLNNNFASYSQTNPRKIALNCIDFWTDSQDLSSLTASPFHSFRTYHIYEKYIMHGCGYPVPLSTNTIDDCSDAIFCVNGALDPNLFAAAEAEVLEFLIAEVFPTFERTSLGVPVPNASMGKGGGGPSDQHSMGAGRRKSLFKSPDKPILTTMMQKILADPIYLAVFKTYMIDMKAEVLLYGYNDLVEIRERVSHLMLLEPKSPRANSNDEREHKKSQQPASDGPSSPRGKPGNGTAGLEVFLTYINNIYDIYLSLGARFRLPVSETAHDDFRVNLCRCKAVDENLLQPIENLTFDLLIREHLDLFLNTSEYRALVRAGRGSILVIAGGLKHPLLPDPATKAKEIKESTNSYFGGAADLEPEKTTTANGEEEDTNSTEKQDKFAAIPHRNTITANASSNSDDVISRMQLKSFIHAPHNDIFGRYLEGKGRLSMLHFYQSAVSFQSAKYRNDLERIAAARSIFDRYVSRNSDEFIGLPNDMRAEIVTGLLVAPSLLFKDAADVSFAYIHDHHWAHFKRHVYNKAVTGIEAKTDAAVGLKRRSGGPEEETELTNASAASTNEEAASQEDGGGTHSVNRGKSDTIQQQQREVLERNFPSHSERFVEFALMCFPGEEEELNEQPELAAPDVIVNSKSSDNGKITPSARRGGILATLFGSKPDKNTVIPVSTEPEAESASMSSLAAYPDEGESVGANNHMYSMSELLRENCQQSRRRSLLHEPDPFHQAAEMIMANTPEKVRAVHSRRSSVGGRRASNLMTPAREEEVVGPTAAVGGNGKQSPTSRSSIDPKERHRLVLSVLSHPRCCAMLKAHLEANSTSQTILFIVELEDYLRIPDAAYRALRARKIYSKYLHPLSIIPVPIPAASRAAIQAEIETAGPGLFKQAHDDVISYIELCQFPTFIASPDWKEAKSMLDENKKNEKDAPLRSYVSLNGMGDMRSLRGVLNNQLATRYFKDFCHRTFVNESLFFWLDVENYCHLPGTDYMRRSAYKICRKYIFDNAKQQINISHTVRAVILRGITNPDKNLFKAAQSEIFKLLELDAFPKFLRGAEYEAMVEALKVTAADKDAEPTGVLKRALTLITGSGAND